MQYIRLSTGLNNYKLIPDTEDVQDLVHNNREQDYYTSIYKYNEEQYQQWKQTKSLSGIKNVSTNKLVFDFDDANNLENARQDTITTISRLTQYGIPQEAVQIAFSGNKGFSLEVITDKTFTVEDFKTITATLAGDLPTYDTVVNDPQRIFRVVGTKHQTSGLYKIPLSTEQLIDMPIDSIKEQAKDLTTLDTSMCDNWNEVRLPEEIYSMRIVKPKEIKKQTENYNTKFDLTAKPKWLTPVKFALQEGNFKEGERSVSLIILAATYKNQGINKEIAYRMLKGVAELQARKHNTDRYSDKEIYNNVINVVYGENWKGGQYSQDHSFLINKAKELDLEIPGEEKDQYTPYHIHNIHEKFKDYILNIDKNTIKTGIPSLDEHVFISVGCNLGICGAPAAGKTALALNILNNTSKAGIKTVFASFDMAKTRMYEKILYKITGLSRLELYRRFKEDPNWEKAIHRKVEEEFGNVFFFDKSAASVEDIKQYIINCNERATIPEQKVKLVMIDYFERVQSDIGDDTAASKKVACQLQDLVNEFDIAQIVLLQPNKMSGDMSEPITSYTSVKGSSFLAQSFRIVLSIFREGFSPNSSEDDKYLTINTLKNDLGEARSMDFYWNGKRGEITEIDHEGLQDLKRLRENKSKLKDEDSGF